MFIYCGHSVLDTGLKKKRFHSVLVNVHVRKPTGPNRERMNMRTDAQECELSQWQVWKAHPILSFKFIPAFERLDVVSELSPSSCPCLCLFFFRLLIPFTCPVLHHHLSTFSISTSSSHIAVSSHMSCLVNTFNPRSLRTPWLCTLLACFFFLHFQRNRWVGKWGQYTRPPLNGYFTLPKSEVAEKLYLAWFCQSFLPVKSEFFLPTVAKVLADRGSDCWGFLYFTI